MASLTINPIDPSGFKDTQCLPIISCDDLCCPGVTLPTVFNPDTGTYERDDATILAVISIASEEARIALGGLWGQCVETVAPNPCSRCERELCRCGPYPRLPLTLNLTTLVSRVYEVMINGETQPLSDYRLDNDRYLVKKSGEFPAFTSLTPNPNVLVRALFGREPDILIKRGVQALACELLSGCKNLACKVPDVALVSQAAWFLYRASLQDIFDLYSWRLGLDAWDKMIEAHFGASTFVYDPDDFVNITSVTWNG